MPERSRVRQCLHKSAYCTIHVACVLYVLHGVCPPWRWCRVGDMKLFRQSVHALLPLLPSSSIYKILYRKMQSTVSRHLCEITSTFSEHFVLMCNSDPWSATLLLFPLHLPYTAQDPCTIWSMERYWISSLSISWGLGRQRSFSLWRIVNRFKISFFRIQPRLHPSLDLGPKGQIGWHIHRHRSRNRPLLWCDIG